MPDMNTILSIKFSCFNKCKLGGHIYFLSFSFPFYLVKHEYFKYVSLPFKAFTNFMIIEHQHITHLIFGG